MEYSPNSPAMAARTTTVPQHTIPAAQGTCTPTQDEITTVNHHPNQFVQMGMISPLHNTPPAEPPQNGLLTISTIASSIPLSSSATHMAPLHSTMAPPATARFPTTCVERPRSTMTVTCSTSSAGNQAPVHGAMAFGHSAPSVPELNIAPLNIVVPPSLQTPRPIPYEELTPYLKLLGSELNTPSQNPKGFSPYHRRNDVGVLKETQFPSKLERHHPYMNKTG